MGIALFSRRRSLLRLGFLVLFGLAIRWLLFPQRPPHEIQQNNYLERVIARGTDKVLDVQSYPFLQARFGRDERPDLMSDFVDDGTEGFWNKFQLPFMTSPETQHIDGQALRNSIETLLGLNGWVAAACPTLVRPFGQNRREESFEDIVGANKMYYIAVVLHSADHFLVDQLATIVQLARRLGTRNIFVSILDYDSRDSTGTLTDLSEAVLTLLSIPFRIRRIPPMTDDETAAYYPLEEAYTRNLALEPLHELKTKRGIKFDKVIWLKGFTCPNDILESLKVSFANKAAMTCGMDWAESNGFFIFSDRWRTRDMDGDQFRASRSSSPSAPPREAVGAARYAAYLPFQVFCCESGTHIVDPTQSYYRGLKYRSSDQFYNASSPDALPTQWDDLAECMDSTQAWFCRDIWVESAKSGIKPIDQPVAKPKLFNPPPPTVPIEDESAGSGVKRQEQGEEDPEPHRLAGVPEAVYQNEHADANAGSDFDAVPGGSPPPLEDNQVSFEVPNSHYEPARIMINPRCVTTYAGVSHTRLAIDLFGSDEDDGDVKAYDESRYILQEWKPAPDSFVCQEQQFTGGRTSSKNQRQTPFSIHSRLRAIEKQASSP